MARRKSKTAAAAPRLTSVFDFSPVMRGANYGRSRNAVTASGGIECDLCHFGCNLLPSGPAQAACHIACNATVC